jgi:hypothetical protein
MVKTLLVLQQIMATQGCPSSLKVAFHLFGAAYS